MEKEVGMKYFPLILITIFFCACNPSESAVQSVVIQTLNAPVYSPTFYSTSKFYPSQTPYPTHTAYPTHTPYPSQKPEYVIETSTATVTPTSAPGIGEEARCGQDFTIKVLAPPEFKEFTMFESPSGKYLAVNLEITNITNSFTDRLFEEDFKILGTLNQKPVIFEYYHWGASWDMVYTKPGYRYIFDPFYPGKPTRIIAVFDINPNSKDWVLEFSPSKGILSSPMCSVQVMLKNNLTSVTKEPTPVYTSTPIALETLHEYKEIEWSELVNNADSHKGEKVVLRGDVVKINDNKNFEIVFSGTFDQIASITMQDVYDDIYPDDMVTVYGSVEGNDCSSAEQPDQKCIPKIIGDIKITNYTK
jgi:hypothetical protein